MNTVHCP